MGELIRFWRIPEEYEKILSPFEQEFENFLFERYQKNKTKYSKFFYTIKPLIPRFLQISLRRIKAKSTLIKFPRWPIESYLENFKKEIIKKIRGPKDIPFIWFWPENKKFAFVITHDVETGSGLKKIEKICGIEQKFGLRSTWFFVPEKYLVPDELINELIKQGFEIGVHGLKHDGKLFNSRKIFEERMKKIHNYALKWNAKGFRSPSLIRNCQWLKEIPFEYDSSFPDTDPYGPQPGGCLSVFPFMLNNIIELPVTVPQDHTLFVVLKERDINLWKEKIDWIEKMHGLALIIIHPDYLNKNTERHYLELLEFVLTKKNVWFAKSIEVCRWWQKRTNSQLVRNKTGQWVIAGPAETSGSVSYYELK